MKDASKAAQRRALYQQARQLSPWDRAEINRFAEFLRDSTWMTPNELWDKYGEEYLGKKT